MHPDLRSLALIVAGCALVGGRAIAQPTPVSTAAAPTGSTAVEPKYGNGANVVNARSRDDRPISYRVPTTPGWRTDWPERLEWDLADLKTYRDANEKLGPPKPGENRVVFIGDSITQGWGGRFAALFPNKPYVGRGIGSQTTQQMLIRFRQDVIGLQPKVVVILAGTNDIAGNLGRSTDKMIQDNLVSMIDLAALNKIKVVFCTIMPTTRYGWQPSVTDGAARVVVINKWIKEYSAARPEDVFFVDIHTPMAGANNNMNPQLSGDGTHPNAAGYALISPLVEQAITAALAAK